MTRPARHSARRRRADAPPARPVRRDRRLRPIARRTNAPAASRRPPGCGWRPTAHRTSRTRRPADWPRRRVVHRERRPRPPAPRRSPQPSARQGETTGTRRLSTRQREWRSRRARLEQPRGQCCKHHVARSIPAKHGVSVTDSRMLQGTASMSVAVSAAVAPQAKWAPRRDLFRRGCAPNPTRPLRGDPERPTPRPRGAQVRA